MPETSAVQTQTPAPSPAPVDDDVLYEVVDGRVVETAQMGTFEVLVAAELIQLLISTPEVKRLGRVIPEMLFTLDPARPLKRRPDVAFVSYERWPRRSPGPAGEGWDVMPDLAVEVVSPSNTIGEIIGKVDDYFRAGVRLVWVIFPRQKKVYVYNSPGDVRALQPGDDLDGGAVLPGFRVAVGALFGDED